MFTNKCYIHHTGHRLTGMNKKGEATMYQAVALNPATWSPTCVGNPHGGRCSKMGRKQPLLELGTN